MTPRGFEPLLPPWKGGVLTTWPWSLTPWAGLEPATPRLTAVCSTIELSRIIRYSWLCHIPSKLHIETTKPSISQPSSLGQALDLLVTVSSMHCCTSTPALSTSYSPRGLTNPAGLARSFVMGGLILRGASRLDAFSVYPFQTWLLCHAVGTTTDTPAVCPSRSSRTKDSSPQTSCARAG